MARFLLKLVLFLLIPVLLAECVARLLDVPRWYETRWHNVEKHLPDQNIICFLGTSRVSCAINQELVSTRLSAQLGRPITVLNLGIGNSSEQEQYFFLRKMLERRKTFRDMLILVEAPNGYPRLTRWNDSWGKPGTRGFLSYVLTTSDLETLWTVSSTPVDLKLLVTAEHYLRMVSVYFSLQNGLQVLPTRLLPASFKPPAPKGYRMAEAGGVTNTAAAVEAVKREMQKRPEQTLQPCPDFNSPIVFKSIVEMCHRGSGRVCTFMPPLSTYDREGINFKDCQPFTDEYAQFTERYNIGFINPGIHFSDDDFPDFQHINIPGRDHYSIAIADKLGQLCRSEHLFVGDSKPR